jgi:hypothetical protein
MRAADEMSANFDLVTACMAQVSSHSPNMIFWHGSMQPILVARPAGTLHPRSKDRLSAEFARTEALHRSLRKIIEMRGHRRAHRRLVEASEAAADDV